MSRDRGSVTAELAVALPVLTLLLVVGLSAVNVVTTKMRCVDAAREAARSEARGEPGVAAGARAAPQSAVVSVASDGDTVRANVRVQTHPLGGRLPGFTVEAAAVAAVEPDPDVPPGAAVGSDRDAGAAVESDSEGGAAVESDPWAEPGAGAAGPLWPAVAGGPP
jgi:Flp pilus assembly protein TadG